MSMSILMIMIMMMIVIAMVLVIKMVTEMIMKIKQHINSVSFFILIN